MASVSAMGKHAVNTQSAISYPDWDVLSPVYHPPNYTDPWQGAAKRSEVRVIGGRGECTDSLGIKRSGTDHRQRFRALRAPAAAGSIFIYFSPPRINANPTTASLASDVKTNVNAS